MEDFRYSDEKVGFYSKEIEISGNIIFASVYAHATDGHCLRRCKHKAFYSIFRSHESLAIKANKWADEQKEFCLKYEAQKV